MPSATSSDFLVSPAATLPLALELQGVTVAYGERIILQDISLQIRAGQVVSIMGGSGSGKTTLLRAASGQLLPRTGKVCVLGQSLEGIAQSDLYALRRRMGVLFQHGALFTDLTVFDNVAFPLREHTHLPAELVNDLVLMKLQTVGLRGAAELKPAEISGGMARRVALARAIALDPQLVLYDEPFAGLDPISLGVTAKLIRHLSDALGIASVLVTHDVKESFAISDYVYIVGQGHLIAQGTPAELAVSTNPYVKQFLLGEPDGPVAFHYPACDYVGALGLVQ